MPSVLRGRPGQTCLSVDSATDRLTGSRTSSLRLRHCETARDTLRKRSRNGISRSTPPPTRTPAGGLPQDLGPAAYSTPEAPALAEWEARDACVVVNVWVARRRSTIGGTRGAVAGTRCGGAGV